MQRLAIFLLTCWVLVALTPPANAISPYFRTIINQEVLLRKGTTSGGGGGGGGGCTSIAGTVASAVFQLDATCSNSYSGSGQTLSNIIASPADSQAKTDYDFYLGASSSASADDPTFTGSAGSTSAYFAFDGGDFFELKSGINTTFLKNAAKTTGGTDFWIVYALRVPSTGTQVILCCTDKYNLRSTTAGKAQFYNGAGHYDSNFTLADATDKLLILSYETSTKTVRMWVNTSTSTGSTLSFTNTNNPANIFDISGYAQGTLALPNNSRVYGFAMGNAFIDNTTAASIISYYNTLHGRTYALDLRHWLKDVNRYADAANDNPAIFERRRRLA